MTRDGSSRTCPFSQYLRRRRIYMSEDSLGCTARPCARKKKETVRVSKSRSCVKKGIPRISSC
jgi:hypothetical protein